jgi:hypothetical protein
MESRKIRYKLKSYFLIIVLFLGLFFPACNTFNTRSAIAYNDFLVHSIDTVISHTLFFEDVLYSETYEDARKNYNDLVANIHTQIKKVSEKEVFDNNDEIKSATLKWIEYYKSLAENEYKNALEILGKPELTETDEEEIGNIISSTYTSDKETELQNTFVSLQQKMSKIYNFRIEDKNENKEITP